MSDETTLLPCPFCGDEAILHNDQRSPETYPCRIYCVNCHAGTANYSTETEAITTWNTRAPVEYDDWFYLPKPKENIVKYDAPRIEKTGINYIIEQPIEVIESAIRSWGNEMNEYIMKRICEVWNTH